jgi:hypothetical protein
MSASIYVNSMRCGWRRVDALVRDGYLWVQPMERDWRETLRNPISGFMLEFSRAALPNSVYVDSREARRMYGRRWL